MKTGVVCLGKRAVGGKGHTAKAEGRACTTVRCSRSFCLRLAFLTKPFTCFGVSSDSSRSSCCAGVSSAVLDWGRSSVLSLRGGEEIDLLMAKV